MFLTHGIRVGHRLIDLHMLDVFLQVALERFHGLAQVCHGTLGPEFGVAVARHGTPDDHRAEPVTR